MAHAKISVVMSVYNCAGTLAESLDSLLLQTYANWELILCDDGSTDGTLAVAERYAALCTDRVTLLRNAQNMGLQYSLNKCLSHATGSYIARQDSDDVSMPTRFAKELSALDADPSLAFVSTASIYFDEHGDWGRSTPLPFPEGRDYLHGTPFCHAACMVRRSAFDLVGGYSQSARHHRVEDYHLWVTMAAKGLRGHNISEALYKIRDDRQAMRRRKFRYRINEAGVIAQAVSQLHLPAWGMLYALRPLLVGLLPKAVYRIMHRRRLIR